MKTKTVATFGLLIALCLVLSYIESLVPAFFAVPGIKLGLTNLVVLTALYKLGPKSSFIINLIRILLVGLTFGNGASLIYSLSGGMLSTFAMIGLKKTNRFALVTVSITGAITHNVGQILAAMVLMATPAIGYYLAILWFTGLLTGSVIGIIGKEVVRRLPDFEI
ncbi:MAG: Gx transporter family protein [Pseudobutyrivibrio sp.]|nr:Gx transporter family protein [Pseudobutyrivibrio sp.]